MRRKLLLLAVLLLLACGGYSAYWLILAHRLEASIGPWAEAERARGTSLAWRSVAVEGFPAAFRLRFADASASGETPLPYTATAPLLLAEARVWNPNCWRLKAPEGARVSLPAESGGIAAAALDGRLQPRSEGGTELALRAHDLAGDGLLQGIALGGATARLDLPAHAPASHLDDGLSVALDLSALKLPGAVPVVGPSVESLSLAATLKGALPAGKLHDALEAWRQEGGTIELTNGSVHWGALVASANGTLALDDKLQPIGALTATIENHNVLVDAAVANGSLRAGDANLVKIMLGLMAKPGADGRKQLTLPLSLQNDRVFLGPAQIAALPRITWR